MYFDKLPSVPHDAYTYGTAPIIEIEERQTIARNVAETYKNMADRDKRNSPMAEDERSLLENSLLFVDYCLPKESPTGKAKSLSVRRCLAVGINILELCDESQIDADDLRQEARLATIRALRSYNPGHSSESGDMSILTLIPHTIRSRLSLVGSQALIFGLKSSGGLKVPSRQDDIGASYPLSAVARNVFSSLLEGGHSDAFTELLGHRSYKQVVPLEVSESGMVIDQEHEVSLLAEDELPDSVKDSDLPPDFDTLLELFRKYGINVTESTEAVLRDHFVNNLTYKVIGESEAVPISQQALGERVRRLLGAIRRNDSLMNKLRDLA